MNKYFTKIKKLFIIALIFLSINTLANDFPANDGTYGGVDSNPSPLFPANGNTNTQTIDTTNTSNTNTSSNNNTSSTETEPLEPYGNPTQGLTGSISTGENVSTVQATNQQASTFDSGAQTSSKVDQGELFKGAAGETIGCSAGQLLANFLSSLISQLIDNLFENLFEGLLSSLFGEQPVPTEDIGKLQKDVRLQTKAEKGKTVSIGPFNVMVGVSWDSIAYCIVNAMIEYIANSTIAWINSGFEGNPAFVTDPEGFFRELADLEAAGFLNELAYGQLGLNVCEPFRAQITLSIARNFANANREGSYSRGFTDRNWGNGPICSLDQVKGNFKNFLGGDFSGGGGWDTFFQVSQIDSNNPYAVYFNLSAELAGAVNKKVTVADKELSWNKGFLSFRKCDGDVPKSDRDKCPITTPGNIIADRVNKALDIPSDRLVLADKFDQVVTALVNKLIQTALDKVFDVAE